MCFMSQSGCYMRLMPLDKDNQFELRNIIITRSANEKIDGDFFFHSFSLLQLAMTIHTDRTFFSINWYIAICNNNNRVTNINGGLRNLSDRQKRGWKIKAKKLHTFSYRDVYLLFAVADLSHDHIFNESDLRFPSNFDPVCWIKLNYVQSKTPDVLNP